MNNTVCPLKHCLSQVDAVQFSLYVNGFFKHEGVEVSISLSPFVLVRPQRKSLNIT